MQKAFFIDDLYLEFNGNKKRSRIFHFSVDWTPLEWWYTENI